MASCEICSLLLKVLLGTLLHLPKPCQGSDAGSALLPLKTNVPMGYDASALPIGFRFRIRNFQPLTPGTIVGGTFRLPESISAIHYDLQIRPIIDDDSGEDTYSTVPGTVTIRIKCLMNATRSIILHAKRMQIHFFKIKITPLGNELPVKMTGFNHDENDDREIFTIFLNSDLIVDEEYLLTIPFKSVIASEDERQTGIYSSSYLDSDGNIKTLVATHFQKVYAREAFPCFDEPSHLFKATFSIRIGRKSNYMSGHNCKLNSFSNTERVGDPEPIKDLPGWVWDTYEKTMRLPVYDIAFALASDYSAEASPSGVFRVPIRTLVPKSQLTNTSAKFSARASATILKFLEELLDFPLPISNMENLAVPMRAWGMEHAGLVTFRPILLLFNVEENTQFQKWNSAWMIAHEYTHQWFGNIVTCEWWNDFWLNEGFARYFQFVIPSEVFVEEFRPADRFVIDVVQWAMLIDVGPESMPVHRTDRDLTRIVVAPSQIDYEKAAALIRMMETFVTKKTFFNALKNYLKRHKFGNTVQDDLFQALTEQATVDKTLTGHSVKDIMDTWTNMKGFPVIRVSRADNDTICLSQHRFAYHPSYHNIECSLWNIPIWFITKSNPKFRGDNTLPDFWMDEHTITTYFTVKTTDEWIVVNPEARGYYRVIYDDHLTNLIMRQLETDHTVFDCSTRSQLIDDFFKGALARYIPIRKAMDITRYLPKEDDLIVWTTVLNNFRSLYTRLIDTNAITQFRKYLISIIIPPLKRLGVPQPANDTPSNIMLRSQFLDWACALKHELCTEYAGKMLAKWMGSPDGNNPILPDYQAQLYCAALACCQSHNMYNFLLIQYKKSRSWQQKNLIIKSLACDQTEEFLKKLLNKTIDLNDKDIEISQHGELILETLASSSLGRDITWNFIRENHEKISEIHGSGTVPWILSTLASFASSRGTSKLDIEVTSFIFNYIINKNGRIDRQILKSLQKSAHKIVENSYWMEYYYNDLREWLMLYVRT